MANPPPSVGLYFESAATQFSIATILRFRITMNLLIKIEEVVDSPLGVNNNVR